MFVRAFQVNFIVTRTVVTVTVLQLPSMTQNGIGIDRYLLT